MREKVFDYNSVFKYTKVSTDEQVFYDNSGQPEDRPHPYPLINLIVHKLIVFIFYTLFIITFPISAIFCVQRIQSLQRCLVYRLGIRLPIKGPGLIIKFPFIDCIEIIDLSDYEFVLVDKTQQLLSSDGSIIEFNSVKCCLSVVNAIRSSTQLKDAKFNAKQFCKLSFLNMIAGTHVEDLENKTDIILRQFEDNCNLYLNNWGYNCKFNQLPTFVVINRANPINPIISQLKSMFGGQQTEDPNGFMAGLKRFQTSSSPRELNDSQIIESLQSMAKTYDKYVFQDIYIAIQVKQLDSNEFFIYSQSKGEVKKLSEKPNKVHINISAETKEQLMSFCFDNDLKSVRITTNLL